MLAIARQKGVCAWFFSHVQHSRLSSQPRCLMTNSLSQISSRIAVSTWYFLLFIPDNCVCGPLNRFCYCFFAISQTQSWLQCFSPAWILSDFGQRFKPRWQFRLKCQLCFNSTASESFTTGFFLLGRKCSFIELLSLTRCLGHLSFINISSSCLGQTPFFGL